MFFNTLTHSKVWSHLLILYNDGDDSRIRTMIVFKQQCCLKEEREKNHKNINLSTETDFFLNASKLFIGSVYSKSRTLQ